MYSYDRTAAIKPLVIDETRVRIWLDHLKWQEGKRVKDLFIFKGPTDTSLGVSARYDDGSGERYEIKLKFAWKLGALHIDPHIRGISQ